MAKSVAETSDNEREILEEFLLDIDCLDPLEKWTNKLNIFDVLSISHNEIRHSNFLAWLLNPRETHGLDDYFLKKVLQKVIRGYSQKDTPISIFELDLLDLDDSMVLREANNIDIQIISRSSKLVFTIENKLYTGEHDEQLQRYRELTDRKYPDYRKIYTYLTLDGNRSSDDEWVPLSYEYIHNAIKQILDNRELSNRCRIYLEDYASTLGAELMNDEELKSICADIYNKHKKAIDLLMQNLPSKQSILLQRVNDLLDQYEGEERIIRLKSPNYELRFTTQKIKDKIGPYGDDTWIDDKNLLAFYVPTSRNDDRYMVMTLGPGDQKCREEWFAYLKETELFACQFKNLTRKYKDISTYRIREDYDTDEQYIEAFMSKVKAYIDNIGKVEEIILKGPDYGKSN